MNRSVRTRLALRIGVFVLLALTMAWQVPVLMRGPARVELEVQRTGASPASREGPLRVLSLNLAHGRGRRFHQLLISRRVIERNLRHAAAVIEREAVHVVAVQEADGPSAWSGRFNHVEFLAEIANLGQWTRGEHAVGLGLTYGTAVLSSEPMSDAESITFEPTPPTPPKGFVVATIIHPNRPGLKIDVVSVHLDFARRGRRRKQVEHMIEVLAPRGNPLVIMGDFNCQWTGKEQTLQILTEGLGLHAYEPQTATTTFPFTDKRLDWVLVSKGVEFERYTVLEDPISDHLAVTATLNFDRL